MHGRALRSAGAYLHAAVWAAYALLTAGEIILTRYVPHMLWLALAVDLFLVSPLLLGRQAWYMSVYRPADVTQEYCLPDSHALRWSVFLSLRTTYANQWRQAIAWRWGWWWRSAAAVAVSLLPAMVALCLSFLVSGSGVLAAGVRLSLQVGAAVAALVGCVVALWWVVGYYPAVYLIAAGETVSTSFAAARRMMRGHEGQWMTLLIGGAWCFAVAWVPVGGWYALSHTYGKLAAFALRRWRKIKKA